MFVAVWQHLEQAAVDPDASLRWPVVATVGVDGPSARLMVLRAVDRDARTLSFYTDRRAAKAVELASDSRIALTGYDASSQLQLRLQGIGYLLTGSSAAARWHTIGDSGRRAYATTQAPGSRLDRPGSGLPEQVLTADAQANFAVLEVIVDQLEWLLLAASGHRRARYEHIGGMWDGSWRVP